MEEMNMLELENAWQQLSKTVALSPIHNRKDYERMVLLADHLSDAIGCSKKHSLLNLFEIVCELIRSYEREYFPIDQAKPQEILKFLMDQHGLRQSDLPEIGNQSVISQILSGARKLNLRQVKAMSKRFGISPSVLIEQPIKKSVISTRVVSKQKVKV